MSDLFWSYDPWILIQPDKLTDFFPRNSSSRSEKLNAIARLGIYISIVISMYNRNWKYMYIGLLFLIVTQFLFSQTQQQQQEMFDTFQEETEDTIFKNDIPRTKPTYNNPFMNPSIVDDYSKPPGEIYYDNSAKSQSVRNDIDDKFGYNLYKDVDDVFNNSNSQRQFYTVPPNDQGTFTKWLYGNMASCKDNNLNCLSGVYEDPRFNSSRLYQDVAR